ncbi:hypothetical protein HAX54_049883 [Datura stramonium]|uniref:Uncharacterized protein n=1 Tax=Datura stramonium TaxID=4076 RepID=A0ABS8SW95_DATST|nr:hypothetical protein [Datura stramonium]
MKEKFLTEVSMTNPVAQLNLPPKEMTEAQRADERNRQNPPHHHGGNVVRNVPFKGEYEQEEIRPKVLLEKVSGIIKKDLLLTPRCIDQQRDATYELVRDRFRSLFRCYAIMVAWEPLNGGSFHLTAGVWKTSASKQAQPRGSKIASPNGTDIDLHFVKAWSTLCRSLPLSRGDFTWLPHFF